MAVRVGAVMAIIGGVLVHLTLGTFYTFGNLSPYLTSYLRKHTSASDLNYGESVWISALAGMGQGLTMFFGGLLERRIGPRLTVLLGAWFQSLGTLLTYFAIQHSFAAAMVTYGLMFGFGMGVAYAVPLAVGMRWLPQHKGFVNGCVVAGFGGGAFIFDQIQTAYINPNNMSPDLSVNGNKYFTQDEILDKVPAMFLILSGCYATMQLIGCLLLRNPPDFGVSYELVVSAKGVQVVSFLGMLVLVQKENKEEANSSDEDSDRSPIVNSSSESSDLLVPRRSKSKERAVSPKELLKEREFYILWTIFLLNGQGVSFISSLYKAYGQTFISDDVFLAAVGTFAAVCNAFGRIMWGTIADRFSFKIAMMFLCTLFTCLMLTLAVTSVAGRWMFILWVGLLFLAFSGSFSLMPTACAKTFGSTYYTMNYGILFTSQVITAPISATLTSSLQTAIGWFGMFYLVAAFSFVSFILSLCFQGKMPDGKEV